MCNCEPETFFSLLQNVGHLEYELFLMLVVDGLLMGLAWPLIKKHIQHHDCPEDKK